MRRSKCMLAGVLTLGGVLLSGCGENAAADALGTDTMLGVPLGEAVSVDLDGDGSAEEITVRLSNKTEMSSINGGTWRFAAPVLWIGEDYFDEEAMTSLIGSLDHPDAATWFVMDIDTSDNYREIAISHATGVPDSAETILLRYRSGELEKIGSFPDAPLERLTASDAEPDYDNLPEVDRTAFAIKVPGDGTVSGVRESQIIQTDYINFVMKLENANEFNASLSEQEQEYYDFLGAVENSPAITTLEELAFYKEKDGASSETVTVPERTEIVFLRYYPEGKWIEMKYESEETAWFRVDKIMDTIALPDGIHNIEECFAGLILGG